MESNHNLDSIWHHFLLDEETGRAFGYLSPIAKVNLSKETKLAYKIPINAEWFCWAHPLSVHEGNPGSLNLQSDDPEVIFATRGGYIYFKGGKHKQIVGVTAVRENFHNTDDIIAVFEGPKRWIGSRENIKGSLKTKGRILETNFEFVERGYKSYSWIIPNDVFITEDDTMFHPCTYGGFLCFSNGPSDAELSEIIEYYEVVELKESINPSRKEPLNMDPSLLNTSATSDSSQSEQTEEVQPVNIQSTDSISTTMEILNSQINFADPTVEDLSQIEPDPTSDEQNHSSEEISINEQLLQYSSKISDSQMTLQDHKTDAVQLPNKEHHIIQGSGKKSTEELASSIQQTLEAESEYILKQKEGEDDEKEVENQPDPTEQVQEEEKAKCAIM